MKNILGFILGIIVCLIIVEAFVSNSFVMEKFIYVFDQEVGRIFRPNSEYVKFCEGFGIGSVNKYSFLNKEYPIEKPENSIRIALLGDSFVESFQVFDRHYFGRVMENILREKLKQPVEVLNFGRSGFDLGDCYVHYNTFVKKFNPDYIIYIFGDDDFSTRNSEPFLPIVKIEDDSLSIEKPQFSSKYIKKVKIKELIFSNCALINNSQKSKKLLKKDYIFSQLFDKLYPKTTETVENTETNITPKINITPKLELILSNLAQNNGYFFLRSNIELSNSKFTFHNINQIFENKDYNPHEWKITKTSGHWNNRAHKEIGGYLAKEMESIIQKRKIEAIHQEELSQELARIKTNFTN